MAGITLVPPKFYNPALTRPGRFAGRLGKNSRHRALINLSLRLSEHSGAEREAVVDEMFTVVSQVAIMMAESVIHGLEKIQPRVDQQRLGIIKKT